MSESRFFIDHGVIHDRVTGRHVRTGGNVEGSLEDGIEECCRLLNDLARDGAVCLKCREPHDGSQWSSCEHCSVRRTRFINDLEDLLGVAGRGLSSEEMLDQIRARITPPPDAYDSSTHDPSCMCENVCKAEKTGASDS